MKFDIVSLLIGLGFFGIFALAWGALLDFRMTFEISMGMNLGIFLAIGFHFLMEGLEKQGRKEK